MGHGGRKITNWSSFWSKYFVDEPSMIDEPVVKTWRNSRLDGMKAVVLTVGNMNYGLHTSGCWAPRCIVYENEPPHVQETAEFWQSDDYEAVVGGPTERVRRRIQMKVDDGWLTLEVEEKTGEHRVYLAKRRI